MSLRFYQSMVLLKTSVLAGRTANLAILTPEGRCWCLPYSQDRTIGIPYRAAGYTLAFSGATADTEAVYGLGYELGGLNLSPPSQAELGAFRDTGRFEPDDGEAARTPILPAEMLISYLHKNDIDFYYLDLAPKRALPNIECESTPEDPPRYPRRLVFGEGGGALRYTSDGSEPTTVSPLVPRAQSFQNPRTILAYASGTYKFKSFQPGFFPSETMTIEVTSGWSEGMVPQDLLNFEWLLEGSGADTAAEAHVHVALAPVPGAFAADRFAADRFGRPGAAFELKGTQDFLYANLQQVTGQKNLSLWFKTSSKSARIFGSGNAGASGTSSKTDGVFYVDDEGLLRFGFLDAGAKKSLASSSRVDDGAWHHALARIGALSPEVEGGGRLLELYLDGALAGFAENPSYSNVLTLVRLGYDSLAGWPGVASARSYAGLVDDVRVYAKPLAPEEVVYLHEEKAELRPSPAP